MEKTRKCSSTTGLILISKSFDFAVTTSTVNLHICFTRLAKEKKTMFYIYSHMVCFEWYLAFQQTFLVRWLVVFFFNGELSNKHGGN